MKIIRIYSIRQKAEDVAAAQNARARVWRYSVRKVGVQQWVVDKHRR